VDIVAQSLKAEKGDNNNTKLTGVLIANKTDLEDRRIISPKVGAELAQQLGLLYFECSAKDFKDVENPFYYLANEWHKIYTETTNKLIEP
jgi:transport family protein 27